MSNNLSPLCGPIISRGKLKHSWLENEVLNKEEPEIVVALRYQGGWPELQGFPDEVAKALALAEEVEWGFSPANLVDVCAPLLEFPDEQRCAIREAVHSAYMECFDAHGVAKRLRESAIKMKEVLASLLEEWNKPDGKVSNTELQTRWIAVLVEAKRLCKALDALPKGIVFP
jgi:hypothetical protein